jgi:hypothetical protein
VLGLEAARTHVAKARLMQLPGRKIQHALAGSLSGETAVAVAMAELFQFEVQVAHVAGFLGLVGAGAVRPCWSRWLPQEPQGRVVVAGV